MSKIKIGEKVSIYENFNNETIIKNMIGNNTLIANKIFITNHSHVLTDKESIKIPPRLTNRFSKRDAMIEENVSIGKGIILTHYIKYQLQTNEIP